MRGQESGMAEIVEKLGTERLDQSRAVGSSWADSCMLIAISAAVALVHILTNNRYGFHRDELQFLSDARHLDWGFVAYPPLTPFLERISLGIFGISMVGLRLFSVLAQALVLLVSGLMAQEFGGGRMAQMTSALAVAFSALPLFEGTEFQYSSFDFLWWVLIAYLVIRLVKTEDPRWWLGIGATVGVGLMTKYTMAFYVAGILTGLLLTRHRRAFLGPWFWGGTALAVLIFLPNLLWQIQHGFISLHFLQHIHARDIGEGRANGFFRDQVVICTNPFAAPLWIAGLVFLFRSSRLRPLAWMYLIPIFLFVVGKGRGYYLGAAYPMLIAAGAVAGERWLASTRRWLAYAVEGVFFAGLAVCGAYICAVVLPLMPVDSPRNFEFQHNGDLREEIGWTEMVATVANIRDSLPANQQKSLGILVGNYGEQGAIEILGPAYHLPPPISMTNSAWLRGYPEPPPANLIVLGFSRSAVDRTFTACRYAGHNGNPYGVKNEESEAHPDIFVCAGPREPWPEFWRGHQAYG
jgi:hypothetical protein